MAQIIEQYENLPGVKVSYEDGNLFTGQSTDETSTQSILIIGTAIDGPIGEPVSVNAIGGPKAAEKLFGGVLQRQKIMQNGAEVTVKVPHQGTLIRTMYEAIRSGAEDVRLLRLDGRTAKTELPAKDPNSEVTQPLADANGNQLIPGNVAFALPLTLESGQRLVNIEKVEEFNGSETTGEPFKTFPDSTGYQSVDDTVGNETVYFAKDKFRPGNAIKITYKAKKRTYTEVSRSQNGVDDSSTLGLLTQDTAQTNYFSSQVGNWSDEARHQVNVYVVDAEGKVNTIPSVNSSGKRLWRIGKVDTNVKDELTDLTTASEFKQGGVRFTSAYQEEVAQKTYPALTSQVKVSVDYFYYNDVEIKAEKTHVTVGSQKETFLRYIPESGSLQVYYEVGGVKKTLVEGEHFSIVYPDTPAEPVSIMINSGAGTVGAKLFAYYKTGANSTQGAKLIVNALNAGKAYGYLEDLNDITTLQGVALTVEYEMNENGTIDMENRVIRFFKPTDKKLTSTDTELRFRTKALTGIRTIREFANYVNSLASNNIVSLDVPINAGDVPLAGLLPTDYEVSSLTSVYEYRPIHLGEKFNEDTGKFAVYVDEDQAEGTEERFPWTGTDGFFNNSNLLSTKSLYEKLGGHYELVEGTLDEFDLVEEGIYSKLENYAVDEIYLADAYANTPIGGYSEDGVLIVDRDKSFATQLSQHCAMVTAKTSETIATIGMAPVPDTSLRSIQEYIDLVTAGVGLGEEREAYYISRGINPYYANTHFMYNLATHEQIFNEDGDPIDIGSYISVVFGPEVGLAHEKIGTYATNGACVYAALISQLQPEISTTNRDLGAAGVRYTLSESQHNQLAGARYVTFDSKLNANGSRTIVVKDGVTASLPNSDYQRLSTIRITHATVQLIRQKANKFIGLPNGISQRNSLATEIQAGLDRLKELGVLENFKFSIFSSSKDRVLGNAFITLELVPAYEMRKIYTSVALRASL